MTVEVKLITLNGSINFIEITTMPYNTNAYKSKKTKTIINKDNIE